MFTTNSRLLHNKSLCWIENEKKKEKEKIDDIYEVLLK